MSKRSYKVMQDIDLSQNDLNKVSRIYNGSNIDIQSDSNLELKSNDLTLKTITSDDNTKIHIEPSTIQTDVAGDLSFYATKNINIGKKSEANTFIYGRNFTLTSKTEITKEDGKTNIIDQSTLDVNNTVTEYADVKYTTKTKDAVIDNHVRISWDSDTRSLLFQKEGN